MHLSSRLLLGFAVVMVLAVVQGISAVTTVNSAGWQVTQMYDNPLMAINFARSANMRFVATDRQVLAVLLDAKSEVDLADIEKIKELYETAITSRGTSANGRRYSARPFRRRKACSTRPGS